jgi:two-component sensor histidine kinase
VLTRRHWEGADIYEVIDASLGAYRNNVQESRLEVAGPDIRLRPKAALALSMALHELATNAAKYGALSTDAGRVDVNWSITDTRAPRFSFRWVESNGPPVTTPQRRGFGSRLIERGLAQDLDGNIRLEFPPSGVICIIDAPLQEIVRAEDGRAGESP